VDVGIAHTDMTQKPIKGLEQGSYIKGFYPKGPWICTLSKISIGNYSVQAN
jgi:hypothetical protein